MAARSTSFQPLGPLQYPGISLDRRAEILRRCVQDLAAMKRTTTNPQQIIAALTALQLLNPALESEVAVEDRPTRPHSLNHLGGGYYFDTSGTSDDCLLWCCVCNDMSTPAPRGDSYFRLGGSGSGNLDCGKCDGDGAVCCCVIVTLGVLACCSCATAIKGTNMIMDGAKRDERVSAGKRLILPIVTFAGGVYGMFKCAYSGVAEWAAGIPIVCNGTANATATTTGRALTVSLRGSAETALAASSSSGAAVGAVEVCSLAKVIGGSVSILIPLAVGGLVACCISQLPPLSCKNPFKGNRQRLAEQISRAIGNEGLLAVIKERRTIDFLAELNPAERQLAKDALGHMAHMEQSRIEKEYGVAPSAPPRPPESYSAWRPDMVDPKNLVFLDPGAI